MLGARELGERIAEAIEVADFPPGPARRVWELMCDRMDRGEAVDRQAMLGCASAPEVEAFGGRSKILDLAELDVLLASAPTYVRALLELAIDDRIEREMARPGKRRAEKLKACATRLEELPFVLAEAGLARHGFHWADTLTEKRIEWTWERRMAKGKLTLLAGFGGVGKGLVAVRLSADVTRGNALPGDPDGTRREPAVVAFISMEDNASDTILPRLRLAGADLEKVAVWGVEVEAPPPSLPSGAEALCKWIEEHRPALLILDPITSFFDKDIDMNRDTDVRRALRPLVRLAAELGFVILGIIHIRKAGNGAGPSSSEPAFHRILGSVGLPNVARSTVMLTRIPGEVRRGPERALVFDKVNLAPDDAPATKICLVGHNGEDHPSAEWRGDLDLSADSLFDGPAPAESLGAAVQDATDFLLAEVEDGPRASTVLQSAARDAGISWPSCRRAKEALNGRIVARQSGGVWLWELAGEESAQ